MLSISGCCFFFLKITVYAAYLYDAVMLWARAADNVTRSGGSITDGKTIISKLLGIYYESMSLFLCI
jgi:guanylate cyclase